MKFKKMMSTLFKSGKSGVDWAKDKTLAGTAITFLVTLKKMFRSNPYFKNICDEAITITRKGNSMSDEEESRLNVLAAEITSFINKKVELESITRNRPITDKQKELANKTVDVVKKDLKNLEGYDKEDEVNGKK